MILLNRNVVMGGRFPNGEVLPNIHGIKENNKIALFHENDGELLHLKALMDYISSAGSTATLFISHMPYSRMDRVEHGQVFALKTFANLINSMNFAKVYVLEPHSDVTTALLDRCEAVEITNILLSQARRGLTDEQLATLTYVMPDAGAAKRYKLDSDRVLVANKKRCFRTGIIEKIELTSTVKNPNVAIILDDLSSRGGTFTRVADLLREQGFSEVRLAVTHLLEQAYEGSLFDELDLVVGTNSTPVYCRPDGPFTTESNDKLNVLNLLSIPTLSTYF